MEVLGFLNTPNINKNNRAFLAANVQNLQEEGYSMLHNLHGNNNNSNNSNDQTIPATKMTKPSSDCFVNIFHE